MSFFKDISLRSAGSDLIGFMRSGQHNVLLFAAACIPTAVIIGMFYMDSQNKGKPPPPTVTYFESWPASRTVDESKAWIAERLNFASAKRRPTRLLAGLSAWM